MKEIRKSTEKKIINNRLNRLEGQIKGIKKMIDEDAACNDILIQLSAVESAAKSLSNYILENHLYNSVTKTLDTNKKQTVEELVSLLKRFNR